MKPEQPHQVAILGAGIGAEHYTAYRKLPDLFTVKTICDQDVDRAKSLIGDGPSIQIESQIRGVLADPSISIIDICLPPHLHFQYTMEALESGKHVICEKPVVGSLRDVDLLAAQCAKTGKLLSPVFQYRYGPAIAQLRALMDAGLAGKPLVASIETHWNRQGDYYDNPWRGTWKGEQGGAVLGHAIHNHDLLCAVFGPVRQVSAMTSTRVNEIETEDCAAISFELESGALATSSITLGAANDKTRLRFVFENLTATSGTVPYAPAEGEWTFEARGNVTQSEIDACLANVAFEHSGFTGFFEAFADRLAGRANRAVKLEDGRRSLELVTAIYHSARNRSVVTLPLGSDHELYGSWQPPTP